MARTDAVTPVTTLGFLLEAVSRLALR